MNFRKTLILAAVLVAAIVYLTKVSEPRRQAELAKAKLFQSMDVASVGSLDISPKDSPPYTVNKGDSTSKGFFEWSLTDTPTAKLDLSRVEGMVTTLRDLTFDGPIPDSELGNDFSVFGLDKPALTLILRRNDGSTQEVAFGKKNDYLMKRYVKVSGFGGLYMVEDSRFETLNQSRVGIRAKQPVHFDKADVREVVLESSLGRITITQPAVGEWKVLDPEPRDGSKQDIERLFADVQALSADEFIDGGQTRLADFGLTKPTVTVAIKLRDGLKESFVRVVIGEGPRGEGTFFTYDGAPSVFKVSPEKVIPLKKAVIDLRERKLLKVDGKDIERVVSSGSADAAVDIQSAAMDWTVNGKISDAVFVEQLFNDVSHLSAVDFPKSVPADAFSQPFLTLTITKKKGVGGETVVLTVGKEVAGPNGPARYARVGEAGEVALIRDVEAKRIVPHEGALIKRQSPTPASS
jgi:hypothetical protein